MIKTKQMFFLLKNYYERLLKAPAKNGLTAFFHQVHEKNEKTQCNYLKKSKLNAGLSKEIAKAKLFFNLKQFSHHAF